MPVNKATAPNKNYRVGTLADSSAECKVSDSFARDHQGLTVEDIKGVLCTDDGTPLIHLVFSFFGLERYVEQALAGTLDLTTIDGNHLNLTLENLTVTNKK